MSTGHIWRKESAASELAWWLRAARIHIATARLRVCVDCAHCFTVSSAASPLRCWRCGIAAATDPPGEPCPLGDEEGDTIPPDRARSGVRDG